MHKYLLVIQHIFIVHLPHATHPSWGQKSSKEQSKSVYCIQFGWGGSLCRVTFVRNLNK